MSDPTWTDPNKAATAVRKLNEILGINEKGDVTLDLGADVDNAVELIASLYRYSDNLPLNIRVQAAYRAVIDARKADDLQLSSVASRIRSSQVAYLRKPKVPYVLLTTISMRARHPVPRMRLENASICFGPSAPRRFKMPERVRRDKLHHGPLPTGYWSVWVGVKSRDAFSGGVHALRVLDLMRGIWNFRLNRGSWRISMGAGYAPFNRILLGPIHTLHHSSGRSAEDLVWWEPAYVQPLSPLDLHQHLPRIKRFEARVRRSLRRHPHRRFIEESLIRYARALDERDLSVSFLRLWSLLEDLTITFNANHSVTVRRAAFLSSDSSFHRLTLDHLRRWRNRIVHEGESANEAERMINEVKGYVERLLLLLLNRGAQFDSLTDFGRFLDSPTQPSELRRRQSHLKLALKIRA